MFQFYFSLKKFMRKFGKELSNQEILSFFKYLKKNDNEEKINFYEFRELFNQNNFEIKYEDRNSFAHGSTSSLFKENNHSIYDLERKSDFSLNTIANITTKNCNFSSFLKNKKSLTPKKTPILQKNTDFMNLTTPKMFELTEKDLQKTAEIFKRLILMEREVEDLKKDLALKTDFTLKEAFKFFDKNENGFLRKDEFESRIQAIEIKVDQTNLNFFLKRLTGEYSKIIPYFIFIEFSFKY